MYCERGEKQWDRGGYSVRNSSLTGFTAHGKKPFLKVLITTVSALACSVFVTAQAQEITFSDILAAPDDPALNLKYARQQAESGDLLSSAAALERLLYYEPNWDEARLFYAVILYRLGDFKAAEREIDLLETRDLSPAITNEYQKYRKLIKNRLQKTFISGQLSVGYGYDDNVTGIFDEASVASTEEDDTSYLLRGRVRVARIIDDATDLRLVGELNVSSKLYNDLDQNDATIMNGGVGFQGASGPYQWSAGTVFKNVDIDGDNYLTEFGAAFNMERALSGKLSYGFRGSYRHQNFDDIEIGGIQTVREEDRSGIKYDAGARLDYDFTSRLKAGIDVGYEVKRADYAPYEYTGPTANVSLDAFFLKGLYLDLDYIYRDLEYAEFDTFITLTGTREDERQYARGALGIPLSLFFKGNSAEMQNLFETSKVEISVFHDQRDSNSTVYEYENSGAEINYVWRFNK
jgi:hypothetical protein